MENHKEYLKHLKENDPILYSELTSDPTGSDGFDNTGIILKVILFILFIILSHFWVNAQQYEVYKFEERIRNKPAYVVYVSGSVYITPDSLAMYLYEPIMRQMVLYNVKNANDAYVGYLVGIRKPVTVLIWENVAFVSWKKTKSKLYLKSKN